MLHSPPLQTSLAREMFERAFVATLVQSNLGREELAQALRNGDCYECDDLRQHLAHDVAYYLAEAAPGLRAVYRFDPTFAFGEDDRESRMPSEAAAINLLVWAESRTDMLAEQVAALHRALAEARLDWLCPKAVEWCDALRIVIVDDAEVNAHRGYAALIDSVWVRPTRVWSRTTTLSQN